MTAETQAEKVTRLGRETADAAMRSERRFTITKFHRHPDGYFHARITPAGGKPIYATKRFGSWMAPGKLNKKDVLKELDCFFGTNTMDVKRELQRRAKAIERSGETQ